VLEDGLNAAEAATGGNGGLLSLGRRERGVYSGVRDCGAWPVAGIAGDYAREGYHQEHSRYARGEAGHSELLA
jgi:hypothetical protein